jgi:aspartyl protease family protein
MLLKQVMPLLIIAIAVGWLMPAGEGDTLAVGPSEAAPAQLVSAGQQAGTFDSGADNDVEQLLPDRIELAREADGHFYADIDVNHAKVRFMIDTGATSVALTGDDARQIGLSWNQDELQPVARGASGTVVGKHVTIDRMQIGNVQANNVRAVIVPEGLDVSLLGQTFLARVSSVNISGDKMVWN